MPKRLKLVNLILKRFCINHEQATKVVLEVKVKNGGVLRGIKISRFSELPAKLFLKSILRKLQNQNQIRKLEELVPFVTNCSKRNIIETGICKQYTATHWIA